MGWSSQKTYVYWKTGMKLPNFFIIGAAKSGTSSLYMYLNQHPEIFMSPIKEPHFFSFDSDTKLTSGPGDKIYQAITDLETYKHLFDDVKYEKAIGEASTSYLYRSEAARRIHDLIPYAKLIAVLRHPAERAFSAYMHVVRDQRETTNNFEEALKEEEKRIRENWDPIWHFTNVGFYYEQLLRYYNLFPKEQIRVYLYEDLIDHPATMLCDIYKFLSVDPDFIVDRSVKFNVSGKQKSKLAHTLTKLLFNYPNPVRWVSRQCIPKAWRWKVTNRIRALNLKKQQIPQRQRETLTSYFRDDILKLEKLINKDLSLWLDSNPSD
jgi:hypothetical protein